MIRPSSSLLAVACVLSCLPGCGATAPTTSTPAATTTEAVPATPVEPLRSPLPTVACPEQESWLASLSALEQRARESLQMPCVPGPGGRWELALTDLASSPMSEEEHGGTGERITGRFALAFVDGSDARRSGPPRDFELLRAEDWWRSARVDVRGHSDLDGDGLEELFVWIGRADYEGTPQGEVTVMTARGGVVAVYEPAPVGAAIGEIEDVDADGRPDLVSCTPYCGTSPWGASPVPAGGPPNVFRSLPDGSFSNQDPVVLARLRAACPARPERFLPSSPSEDGYQEALTAVSCARIFGTATDEIVRAIRAEHAAGGCTHEGWAECGPLVDELVRHASLTPAHHLP